MPVQLTHIGEDIVAAMLNSLAERQELCQVKCLRSGVSMADDIQDQKVGGSPSFLAEDATLIVCHDNCRYACDGEQKVDVLCAGGDHAIAIEAKLGETRMTPAEFKKRFCVPCDKSTHADARLRGSMIAVLERALPFDEPPTSEIVANIAQAQWTLARPWWLVVRQSVANKWNGIFPVGENARILVFDSLAQTYGTRQQFDQLVQRVLGTDFAGRWRICLTDP